MSGKRKLTADERETIRAAMSLLGSASTPAKKEAGRKNLAKALKTRWEKYRKRVQSEST